VLDQLIRTNGFPRRRLDTLAPPPSDTRESSVRQRENGKCVFFSPLRATSETLIVHDRRAMGNAVAHSFSLSLARSSAVQLKYGVDDDDSRFFSTRTNIPFASGCRELPVCVLLTCVNE
jgi:hypothetical protein